MAIAFGSKNMLTFISALSPMFISFYFVINSFFQGSPRGIIWLIGSCLATIAGLLVKSGFKKTKIALRPFIRDKRLPEPNTLDTPTHDFCEVFEPPFESLKGVMWPSSHAVFHAYTLTYLGLGIGMNPNKPGIPFIIFISILSFFDLAFRMTSKCDNAGAITIGILVGAVVGLAWFYLVLYGGNALFGGDGIKLIYYGKDDLNSPEKCQLGKKSFKCKYKKIK